MSVSRDTSPPTGVEDILALVGADAVVLHSPFELQLGAGGGGDIDCVVDDPDPYWPLRLPEGWRLCQRLQYDITGSSFVLDHEGEAVMIDLLADPKGIGKYGFPDRLVFENAAGLDAPTRATYLAAKRLRKGILEERDWAAIGELARIDPSRFRSLLAQVFGRDGASALGELCLQGAPPTPEEARQFLRHLERHRRGSPRRFVPIAVKTVGRYLTRIVHPTGLAVVVAGPDGSGKSTLADRLPEALTGFFRRDIRLHWRPGLLPSLSSVAGTPGPDVADPHSREPRSRAESIFSLLYYWADFAVGGWARLRPAKSRSTLIVWERGWWDMHVDPRRYRFSALPKGLMRALAVPLFKPDLSLVLEGDPQVLADRKKEVSAEETARQLDTWRALHDVARPVFVSSESGVTDSLEDARAIVTERLSDREMKKVAAGWLSLGTSSEDRPRWHLPRGPRRVAAASLLMYQPVTPKGLVGWGTAWGLARAGFTRALPRGSAPPRELREKLAPHLPPRSTLSVARANHPNRFTAVALHEDGVPRWVAKVALDDFGAKKLDEERRSLERFGGELTPPLFAPQVLGADEGVLLLEAFQWLPRLRPWALPSSVAAGIGAFYARGTGAGGAGGLTHGDFAPWNLLQTKRGWVVVDWEDASEAGEPFHDLFHFFVQAHALLGKPKGNDLVDMFVGKGPLAPVLHAYREAAGLPSQDVRARFVDFLASGSERLVESERDDAVRGVEARQLLLRALA